MNRTANTQRPTLKAESSESESESDDDDDDDDDDYTNDSRDSGSASEEEAPTRKSAAPPRADETHMSAP